MITAVGGFDCFYNVIKILHCWIITVKSKIDPDAAPSSAAATGATAQWRQTFQKPRSTIPAKASRGVPPATNKFDGTCDGLKGCGLVFDFADPIVDLFKNCRR